jgi:hypothetical protein
MGSGETYIRLEVEKATGVQSRMRNWGLGEEPS